MTNRDSAPLSAKSLKRGTVALQRDAHIQEYIGRIIEKRGTVSSVVPEKGWARREWVNQAPSWKAALEVAKLLAALPRRNERGKDESVLIRFDVELCLRDQGTHSVSYLRPDEYRHANWLWIDRYERDEAERLGPILPACGYTDEPGSTVHHVLTCGCDECVFAASSMNRDMQEHFPAPGGGQEGVATSSQPPAIPAELVALTAGAADAQLPSVEEPHGGAAQGPRLQDHPPAFFFDNPETDLFRVGDSTGVESFGKRGTLEWALWSKLSERQGEVIDITALAQSALNILLDSAKCGGTRHRQPRIPDYEKLSEFETLQRVRSLLRKAGSGPKAKRWRKCWLHYDTSKFTVCLEFRKPNEQQIRRNRPKTRQG